MPIISDDNLSLPVGKVLSRFLLAELVLIEISRTALRNR